MIKEFGNHNVSKRNHRRGILPRETQWIRKWYDNILTGFRLCQTKYTIPVPILTKGLTWQRMRAVKKDDSRFSEFYGELMYAFSKELSVADDGWSSIDLRTYSSIPRYC